MAGARVSLQGAAKYEKRTRLYWHLITLLFSKNIYFFIPVEKLQLDSTREWGWCCQRLLTGSKVPLRM